MKSLALVCLLVAAVARDVPLPGEGLTVADKKAAIDQAAQKADAAAELAIAEAQQEEQEEKKIEASVSSDLDLSDIDEADPEADKAVPVIQTRQAVASPKPVIAEPAEVESDRFASLKEGATLGKREAVASSSDAEEDSADSHPPDATDSDVEESDRFAALKSEAPEENRGFLAKQEPKEPAAVTAAPEPAPLKAAKLTSLEDEKAMRLAAIAQEKKEVEQRLAKLERAKVKEEEQLRKAEIAQKQDKREAQDVAAAKVRAQKVNMHHRKRAEEKQAAKENLQKRVQGTVANDATTKTDTDKAEVAEVSQKQEDSADTADEADMEGGSAEKGEKAGSHKSSQSANADTQESSSDNAVEEESQAGEAEESAEEEQASTASSHEEAEEDEAEESLGSQDTSAEEEGESEEEASGSTGDDQEAESFIQKSRQPRLFSSEDEDLQPYLHPRAWAARKAAKEHHLMKRKDAVRELDDSSAELAHFMAVEQGNNAKTLEAAPAPAPAASPGAAPAPAAPPIDPYKLCDELCQYDTGMDGDVDMCTVDCHTYVDAGGDIESLRGFVVDETYNEQGGEKMEEHFEKVTGQQIPDCTPEHPMDDSMAPQEVFKILDENSDQQISKEELNAWGAKQCVPNEMAEQMFTAADADRDGLVSYDEFNILGEDTGIEDAVDKVTDKLTEGEDQYEPVQMPAFRHVDSNSDGKLDKDEVMNIFKNEIRRRIPTMSDADVTKLAGEHKQELFKDMEKVDTDGDGVINPEEYAAAHQEGMGSEMAEAAAADNNLPDPDDLHRDPTPAAPGPSPAASPAPAAVFLSRDN